METLPWNFDTAINNIHNPEVLQEIFSKHYLQALDLLTSIKTASDHGATPLVMVTMDNYEMFLNGLMLAISEHNKYRQAQGYPDNVH